MIIKKVLFFTLSVFFIGLQSMEPSNSAVMASERNSLLLDKYELLYQGNFNLDHLEQQLLNFQFATGDEFDQIQSNLKHLPHDIFFKLIFSLLSKGFKSGFFTTDLSHNRVPTTIGRFICDICQKDDMVPRFIFEMLCFGFTKEDIHILLGEDYTLSELSWHIMRDLDNDDVYIHERADKVFNAIYKQQIEKALTHLREFTREVTSDQLGILVNALLRLSIGLGLSDLVKKLIDMDANVDWVIPTIDGILLQEDLCPEKKALYKKMKNDILQIISEVCNKADTDAAKKQLDFALLSDDAKTFQLMRELLKNYSHGFFFDDIETVIHRIAKYNSYRIFKGIHEEKTPLLLNTFTRDGSQLTPLEMAVFYGNYEILELLIRAGADVHLRAPGGDRTIMIGDKNTDDYRILNTLRILLESGVNPSELDIPAFSNHAETEPVTRGFDFFIIQKFLEYGINLISDQKLVTHWNFIWKGKGIPFPGHFACESSPHKISSEQIKRILSTLSFAQKNRLLHTATGNPTWPWIYRLLKIGANPLIALKLVNDILKEPAGAFEEDRSLSSYQDLKKYLENYLKLLRSGFLLSLPMELFHEILLYYSHRSAWR